MKESDLNFEKHKILSALALSGIVVLLIVLAYLINSVFSMGWNEYGIYPRKPEGLLGILTITFLHANPEHLFSNMFPLFLFLFGLFYFFPEKPWLKLLLMAFSTGLFTWILGRGGNHIGASGLVYALAFFLITISLIKMEKSLLAYTLIIIFLYGSLIWGFFPQLFPGKNISWEGHLAGAVSGIIFAVFFRKEGPQKKKYFEDDDENENDTDESEEYFYSTKTYEDMN